MDSTLMGIGIFIIGLIVYDFATKRLVKYAEQRVDRHYEKNIQAWAACGVHFEYDYQVPINKYETYHDSRLYMISRELLLRRLFARIFWDNKVTRFEQKYIGIGGALVGMAVLSYLSRIAEFYSYPMAATVLIWASRLFLLTPVVQLLRWKKLTTFVRVTDIIYSIFLVAMVMFVKFDIVF